MASIFEAPCWASILEQSAGSVLWAPRQRDAAYKQTRCCLRWLHKHSIWVPVTAMKWLGISASGGKFITNVKATLSGMNVFEDFIKHEGTATLRVAACCSIRCSLAGDVLYIMQR